MKILWFLPLAVQVQAVGGGGCYNVVGGMPGHVQQLAAEVCGVSIRARWWGGPPRSLGGAPAEAEAAGRLQWGNEGQT